MMPGDITDIIRYSQTYANVDHMTVTQNTPVCSIIRVSFDRIHCKQLAYKNKAHITYASWVNWGEAF